MNNLNSNSLAERLGSFDGFFHKLTGVFAKNIKNGTKEVDELINLSLFRMNKSLEMENPFPNVVENQGNIFPYEDFSRDHLNAEFNSALDKLINSNLAK
jgi:hypothetical protein